MNKVIMNEAVKRLVNKEIEFLKKDIKNNKEGKLWMPRKELIALKRELKQLQESIK